MQCISFAFAIAVLTLVNLRFGVVSTILIALYGVVLLVIVLALARWRGLELRDDGFVVRRNLVRRVPWQDVMNVRAGSVLFTKIVVFETVRGMVRSWAPAASPLAPDPDFDAKLAYIRQWWWSARSRMDGSALPWPADRATGWGIPVVDGDGAGVSHREPV